jgi:hypothetical protein
VRCVLASGKKRATAWELTPENAELNRDVISALAHELGGIASALDLRAAAMSRSIPEEDLLALREITEEVRMATRAARFARGMDASGMLNPMRRQSLEEWWKLTKRFTGAVLPRGVTIEPRFTEAQLTALQASALSWIWLAGCKEIAERGLVPPVRLLLQGGTTGTDTASVTLLAEIDGSQMVDATPSSDRWSRHAAKIAKMIGVKPPSWEREDGTVRWACILPL